MHFLRRGAIFISQTEVIVDVLAFLVVLLPLDSLMKLWVIRVAVVYTLVGEGGKAAYLMLAPTIPPAPMGTAHALPAATVRRGLHVVAWSVILAVIVTALVFFDVGIQGGLFNLIILGFFAAQFVNDVYTARAVTV